MNAQTDDAVDFDALWNYDDPAGTEAKFRKMLPSAYHAELLTQIARTQALQRQFDAAHATLDQAQALLERGRHARRLRERGTGRVPVGGGPDQRGPAPSG